MDPFEKVAIGKAGFEITRLGIGGREHGDSTPASDHDVTVATLSKAYEVGINFFRQRAAYYGRGRSEVRFRRVLGTLPRDSFVLSSKVGRLLVTDMINGRFIAVRQGLQGVHAANAAELQ